MEPKKTAEVNLEDSAVQIPSVASCYAFNSAPQNEDVAFLAWHIVWKCWLPIKKRIEIRIGNDSCDWVDATLTTPWPGSAFSHWMPMSPEPDRVIVDADKNRSYWIAGNNTADRILKETIREAKHGLSQISFLEWLDNF